MKRAVFEVRDDNRPYFSDIPAFQAAQHMFHVAGIEDTTLVTKNHLTTQNIYTFFVVTFYVFTFFVLYLY